MMIEAVLEIERLKTGAPPQKERLMNGTQLQTTLMPIITFFAGLLAGKNIFGFDTTTWITILTGVVGFAGTLWAAIATRKTAIVSQAAALPEVNKIELAPTQAGQQLAAATPDNVVVK